MVDTMRSRPLARGDDRRDGRTGDINRNYIGGGGGDYIINVVRRSGKTKEFQ